MEALYSYLLIQTIKQSELILKRSSLKVQLTSKCSTNKHVLANSSNSNAKFVSTLIVPSLTAVEVSEGVCEPVIPFVTFGFFKSFAKSAIRFANHSILSCKIASSFNTPMSESISMLEIHPSPKLVVNISASRIFRCWIWVGDSSSTDSPFIKRRCLMRSLDAFRSVQLGRVL